MSNKFNNQIWLKEQNLLIYKVGALN